jgi:hypothetical protein
MTNRPNPFDLPEWHALRRETALVRHLLGSGATALGRANYADQAGEYYTTFFGLSVGLERLAKLVLVADSALSNSGKLPEQRAVRKFGHKLVDLMNEAESVQSRQAVVLTYERPRLETCAKIVTCLDAFADASRGRYANFAAIGDPNLGEFEPISMWWTEIAELILRQHYHGKPVQRRVEKFSRAGDELMAGRAMVLFVSEKGEMMTDFRSASERTGQTQIVQKYGRFYTLTVARWLACLYAELCDKACSNGIDAFFGLGAFLEPYMVDDSFLKTRKSWP